MNKHNAGHGLPITNGYGRQRDGGKLVSVSVYCGRCGASYTADRDWADRYFAAAEKEIRRQITKGYATRGDLADLADERAEILAAIPKTRRSPGMTPDQIATAQALASATDWSAARIAQVIGISRAGLYRYVDIAGIREKAEAAG